MSKTHDLELILKSHIPIVVVESHEEVRVLDLLAQLAIKLFKPLYRWTITEGLERKDMDLPPQSVHSPPGEVLKHIKAIRQDAVFVLSDFHPYLNDPTHVRLLKDIAQDSRETKTTLVLLSHELEMPAELQKYSARFEMALPNKEELEQIIRDTAVEWTQKNPRKQVRTDRKTLDAFIRNLSGLTFRDAQRLVRKAIYDDGAITQDDLPPVMQAKYELLNADGVLNFEYETASFGDVGGLANLKRWLDQRRAVFHGEIEAPGLDTPKGILLLGVQGCGKSLAAKAVAGIWAVPLLRIDFGALFNKWHGESERNLREALKTAEVMSPCVLWMDEIEKGLSSSDSDGGVSQRMLGTLLTWMSEKKAPAFIVATANDIERLPPELVRKGRFDEVFFVDLPKADARERIFAIHLQKRGLDPANFDMAKLAGATEGFSGSEIEQVVVSGLYSSHAQGEQLNDGHLVAEAGQTRPLSVIMAEKINYLRDWASQRTVPSD